MRLPSVVDDGFFVTSHGVYALTEADEPTVVALDADGGERWRTAIADPWSARLFAGDDGHEWRERVSVAGLGPLSSDGDRVYCIASGDSVAPRDDDPDDEPGLYALSLADGSRVWSTTDIDAATAGRPVVTDETVLVSTDNMLYCLDPDNGSERWATSIYETSGTIIAVDDIVYTAVAGVIRAFRPPR